MTLDSIFAQLDKKGCKHYPVDEERGVECEACVIEAVVSGRQVGLDEAAAAADAAGQAALAAQIRALPIPPAPVTP